jgi:Ca2+-transporting ATPase
MSNSIDKFASTNSRAIACKTPILDIMVHQLEFDTIRGLSEAEAARRLKQEGYNELPTSKKRSLWAIALEIVREPIFLLLVGCGVIYLLLGDAQEALILLGFVFFIIGINLYQEQKTER